MVYKVLALVLAAVVGTGAGLYYALPAGSGPCEHSCPLSAAAAAAAPEADAPSCCSAKRKAQSACCSQTGDTSACPVASYEPKAVSPAAAAAFAGGVAFATAPAESADGEPLAACTGGMSMAVAAR